MSRQAHDAGASVVLSRWRPHDADAIPRTHRLAEAWAASLRRRTRRDLAEASSASLRRGIRAWLRHLAEERQDQPESSTVLEFADRLAATRSAATVALYLAAVRNLYRWAAARGLAPDIAATVRAGGGAEAEAPPPRLDDAAYLRARRAIAGDGLRSVRDRALLACLRAVPVESIAWTRARVGDVDLAAERALLAPRGLPTAWRRGRAGAPRTAFALGREACLLLHAYLAARGGPQPSEPLFASLRGGGALSTLSMRLIVLRCLEAAGLRGRSPGVARNRMMLRYPVVTARDIAGAALPAQPQQRDRTLALLRLLALPRARIAWERLRWAEVDLDASRLVLRRGGRGGPREAVVALTPAAAAALRAWRCHGDGSGAVFGAGQHQLKRLAWAAFPRRLPAGPGRGPGGSTRRLMPA